MRAIQIAETGGPQVLNLVIKNIPTINADQILVKNKFVGVNFIDTYHRTGLYKVPLPYILGREGCGIVDQVGSNVSKFNVGDRVAYLGTNTYAEYTIVNPERATKLTESISFEVGAAMMIQGFTAISLAKYAHRVLPNQTVLIHACAGGTGSLLVQVCKRYGATVIGTTSTPEKKQMALDLGADHVILYTEQNIKDQVMEITKGQGVDCVFDGVGKTTFDVSLSCLKRLGSMLSFGNASGKVDDIDITKLVPRAIRLMRPSLFEFLVSKQDFEEFESELLSLMPYLKFTIHKVYPLEKAGDAHTDLENKKTMGKLLLSFE